MTNGIRWAISGAAIEFSIDRRTLATRLRRADIRPGKDGRYSTRQILAAVCTDIDVARCRKEQALAEKRQHEAEQLRHSLIHVDTAIAVWDRLRAAVLGKLDGMPLSDVEKRECYRSLRPLTKDDFKTC